MNKVSAVGCESYDLDVVCGAMGAVLDQLGYVLPRGQTVLIKPNVMSQNRPQQHTVTHYSVVAALCQLLADNGCRVQIGDSEAFFERGMTRKAFRVTRLEQVAARYGACLVPFEEQPLVEVATGLAWLPHLYLPRALLDADVVINAPKLKSHSGMRLSGALKNMFGCVPGGHKQRIHVLSANAFELSDAFLTIHRLVRPALAVMDAVVGLDGGPAAIGRPVQVGRLLAATNAAALDVVACRIIGYEPSEVATLERAQASGMIGDFNDVEVLGTIEPHHFKRLVRGPIARSKDSDGFFVTATSVDLKVTAACSRCRACIGACPVAAITDSGRRVAIDRQLCLNCYHCLAVCPEDAIRIDPSPMNSVVRGVRAVTGI